MEMIARFALNVMRLCVFLFVVATCAEFFFCFLPFCAVTF